MRADRVFNALRELNDALVEVGVANTRMPTLCFHPEDEAKMKDVLHEILVDRSMVLAGFPMMTGEAA